MSCMLAMCRPVEDWSAAPAPKLISSDSHHAADHASAGNSHTPSDHEGDDSHHSGDHEGGDSHAGDHEGGDSHHVDAGVRGISSGTGTTALTKVPTPVVSNQEQAADMSVEMAKEVATGSCNVAYTQCGGDGWKGPTCCAPDEAGEEFTCQFQDNFYSQCLCASASLVVIHTHPPSSYCAVLSPPRRYSMRKQRICTRMHNPVLRSVVVALNCLHCMQASA